MVSIDSTTRITVRNSTGSSIVAAAGTRLILHSDPVTVYADGAASISYTGVTMASNIASVTSATGSSTSPSLSVPTNSDQGQVFALVSVQSAASTVTLTPGTGLTSRWSSSAGASGSATLTQGAGATRDSTGVSVTMGWTLSASRSWSVIGVVLKPQGSVTIGVPGGVTVGSHSVDARNYASLQAAVDDVAVGGTLMIPNGDYSVPSGGLIVRKPMTIQGETGTNLYSYAATPNQPVIKIVPGGTVLERVLLRDLTLQNATLPVSPAAGNYGLLCDVPTDGSKIGNLTLERVFVRHMGDDGIHLTAYAESDLFFVFVALRDSQSFVNRGRGMFASYANLLSCDGSNFVGNDLDGFRGESCEVSFHASAFENNCLSSDTGRISATLNAQLYLKECAASVVSGCHVENFTGATHPVCKQGIVVEGGSCATIQSTAIVGYPTGSEDTSATARGIYITGGSSAAVMSCCILPNWFFNLKTAIEIEGGTGLAHDCLVTAQRIQTGTGQMLLPTAVSDSGVTVLGNRKLGTGGMARGVALPPHTNTLANPLPTLSSDDAGYLLFDSTSKRLAFWDGSLWRLVQVA